MTNHKEALPFVLGSLITSYPDEYFGEALDILLKDPDLERYCTIDRSNAWGELSKVLVRLAGDSKLLNDYRSLYIDVFDRGVAENSLYETEFGKDRPLIKGNELADIAGFYRAFGFVLDRDEDDMNECHDHIAVELEFYSLLVMKEVLLSEQSNEEGVEIVRNARREFLTEHLGRFVAPLTECPGVRSNESLNKIFSWCQAIVERECDKLGASPLPAKWMKILQEENSSTCDCSTNLLSGIGRWVGPS